MGLQGADRLADRGLRDVVGLSGFGEALGLDQVAIDFKTLKLHKGSEYEIPLRVNNSITLTTPLSVRAATGENSGLW